MQKYKILIFILILISNNAFGKIINYEISSKYKNLFSENYLKLEDIKNYQEIFVLQDSCNWKKANKNILKIQNKILLGHVFAQRYLHPRCYKSEYLELTHWLKKYNDHPQSKKIYRLAIKRMIKGYKGPQKSIKPIGIKKDELISYKKKVSYKSKKKISKKQRIEKQKLINAIKSRVNKGWPTGAVKLLNQRDVVLLLDQVEIDQQKELIAKGYFLANKNELSIKYSKEALEKSANYIPYAGWTAGLAAWRLKKYELAAEFFTNFSVSLEEDVWHQSSAAFWASRAYSKLKKYDEINFWLNRAAKNPYSFYGILASNILGIDIPLNWKSSINIKSNNTNLFSLPSGKRIQALLNVGLATNLEEEIIHVNTILNKEVAVKSLEIAEHLNLAYTQLKIANKLNQNSIDLPNKFFYPTPIWTPLNGFRLEPELIYAFIHQESMFNPVAKSYKGAMGLMQVMPSTAKFITSNKIVKKNDSSILKNPEINLEVGQEYIEYLLKLKIVDHNLIFLTAAYNGGPGNLKKWQDNINYLEDPLFFMESIPSRETRWFIEKVLTKYWIYQHKKGIVSKSLSLLANGENPIY